MKEECRGSAWFFLLSIYIKGMSFILFFLFILIFILIIASSVVISVIRGILSFLGLTKKSTDRGGSGSSYRTAGGSGGRNAQGGAFYGNRGSSREDTRGARSDASGWHYSPEAEYKRRKRKKIIDANEGEYVDFEEVRD